MGRALERGRRAVDRTGVEVPLAIPGELAGGALVSTELERRETEEEVGERGIPQTPEEQEKKRLLDGKRKGIPEGGEGLAAFPIFPPLSLFGQRASLSFSAGQPGGSCFNLQQEKERKRGPRGTRKGGRQASRRGGAF